MRTTAIFAALVLGAVLVGGCTPSQLRDEATKQLDNAERNLGILDAALAAAEGLADRESASALPAWARDIAGDLLPESATVGHWRAFVAGAKSTAIAEVDQAKTALANIDDNDTDLSAWAQLIGAIAPVVAPFTGPAAPWIVGIGAAAAGIGRATGVRKGANAVAGNMAIGAAASPDLVRAMTSGPAHDAMKTNMNNLPKQVQVAIKSNSVSKVGAGKIG